MWFAPQGRTHLKRGGQRNIRKGWEVLICEVQLLISYFNGGLIVLSLINGGHVG